MNSTQKVFDAKRMERELLKSTNNELCDSIRALAGDKIQRLDGTSLHRHEVFEFQEKLSKELKVYKESKQEIAELEQKITELKNNENGLKQQRMSLMEHFQEEEKVAGVAGFRDVNEKLEETSKQTASLNELKSQTLDEISTMVQTIADTLEDKKQELEPKVSQ